jgi:hypothetical protein
LVLIWLYAAKRGGLVGLRNTSNGTRSYYLFDGLGSVAAITSATTGAVLNPNHGEPGNEPYGLRRRV